MSADPGLLERVWEYLSAIGLYWWVALGVLLSAERICERYFHGFWKAWVDPWFTPQRRKHVLTLFAIVAFLYANFRAFDDQRRLARTATAGLNRIQSERKASPRAPSRNPDGLYQLGQEVATVVGAVIDEGNSLVTFPMVRSAGKLDATKEVEYRDLVLRCSGLPPAPPPNVMSGMTVSVLPECAARLAVAAHLEPAVWSKR